MPSTRAPKHRLLLLGLSLLAPLAFFVFLELILALFSYGYPTSFYLKSTISNREVFKENHQFGLRFFPPALNRHPLTQAFPVKKTDTYRVFTLGGSAALGDPFPAYGVGRILEQLLEARYPKRDFEVINAAMTAINSHVVLPIAKDCANKDADLWIVYMGNNEVVGPYGSGTVFGSQTPPMWLIRSGLAFKSTHTGQLFHHLTRNLLTGKKKFAAWKSMEMFIGRQVRKSDPGLQKVYQNFEQNLNDILAVAEKSRVPVIVSTIAVNLRNSPPFGSLHRIGLDKNTLSKWEKLYQSGIEYQTQGDCLKAIESFENALRIDSDYAELHLRIARCQLSRDDFKAALLSFETARDLDTLRFRADNKINYFIEKVAANRSSQGIRLVDAQKLFKDSSSDGIPGQEFFDDHVHFNFHGNYLLALMLAKEVQAVLFAEAPNRAAPEWLSEEECAKRLAFTEWGQYQVLRGMRTRLSSAPFSGQLDHLTRIQKHGERLSAARSKLLSESPQITEEHYNFALKLSPQDPILHKKFALFLTEIKAFAEALKHWQKALELLPHDANAHNQIGNLLVDNYPNRSSEAEKHFRQALALKPRSHETLTDLGWSLAKQKKHKEALESYDQALTINPSSALALNNKGLTLETLGRSSDARASFEKAIEVDPNFLFARMNLGNLFLKSNDAKNASAQFAQAVKTKPSFIAARYYFAFSLSKMGKLQEARQQLSEILHQDPNNKQAKSLLQQIESMPVS